MADDSDQPDDDGSHRKLDQKQEQARERALRSALKEALRIFRFQDFMTLMMVLATLATAVAAWRAAEITAYIYRASERPYLGVQTMHLDLHDPKKPRVAIQYRNFGHVLADATVLDIATTINGSVVAGGDGFKHVVLHLGVLSPDTPYFFGAFFPAEFTEAVEDGRAPMYVLVDISYKDANGTPYCYGMKFHYYAPTGTFDPAGGSDSCG